MYRRIHAFTLVELLVVIGIIALLISVLLPALAKARQQANLIKCSSQMHQMGAALAIYISEDKEMLPWGVIYRPTLTPDNQESFWYWQFALSQIMNKNLLGSDGFARNLSPVFRDNDTITGFDSPTWVCHYACNPRVFYDNSPTALAPIPSAQRKVTDVKHSADVFVIWDAPQVQDQAYNAIPNADSIDAWGWYNDSLVLDNTTQPRMPLFPGQSGFAGVGNGKAFQKSMNYDPLHAFGGPPGGWTSHLRFRHMNNTKLAALCLDGHVEIRAVGQVTRKDIYTNSPQPN